MREKVIREWNGDFECPHCGHVMSYKEKENLKDLCPECGRFRLCDFVVKTKIREET